MRDSTSACSATGKGPVVVMDTGALLAGLQMRLPALCVTTPLVIYEVKDEESRQELESSLEVGKLIVMEPSEESANKAVELVNSLGLSRRLSRADLSVLALAIELRSCGASVSIASDDYALQKASVSAGIDIVKVRYRGIRELKGARGSGPQQPH